VILDPVLDELFVAEAGRGAWLRQGRARPVRARRWRRIRVSRVSAPAESLVGTCSHDMPRDTGNLTHVAALAGRVQRVYTLGSAALELAWVAAGRLEGFWEPALPPWDTVAGALMVREAGGRVTDYAGAPWGAPSRQIVASNGRLHGLLLRCLRADRHGW
jgi:myo-inositol-1(or 4)-monophosphatase